jgi:hypothetical protein
MPDTLQVMQTGTLRVGMIMPGTLRTDGMVLVLIIGIAGIHWALVLGGGTLSGLMGIFQWRQDGLSLTDTVLLAGITGILHGVSIISGTHHGVIIALRILLGAMVMAMVSDMASILSPMDGHRITELSLFL